MADPIPSHLWPFAVVHACPYILYLRLDLEPRFSDLSEAIAERAYRRRVSRA